MKEIIFTSPYNFDLIEETCMQPAKNFIPEHWKNLNYYKDNTFNIKGYNKTAKACPSFVEILKEGYVLPAPCDIWLYTDGDEWKWETAAPVDFIQISNHSGFQYFDNVPNSNVKMVFKLDNTWHAITPKGYSMRQIPMIYHHNPNFYALYGVIDTDKVHQLNPQIAFISDKNEFVIQKGTPLCYYVPFKREKFNYKVKKYNSKLEEKVFINNIKYLASFTRSNYSKKEDK